MFTIKNTAIVNFKTSTSKNKNLLNCFFQRKIICKFVLVKLKCFVSNEFFKFERHQSLQLCVISIHEFTKILIPFPTRASLRYFGSFSI